MKAAVIREHGGTEVLKYEDYPEPTLQSGEVLMRVAGAGVNPVDTGVRCSFQAFSAGICRERSKNSAWSKWIFRDIGLAWAYHTYAEICAVKADLLARVP
jgi:hypothetical protein